MAHKVLVVENEKDWKDIFERDLKEEGYLVTLANSYGEAITAFQNSPYELAVIDLRLVSAEPNNYEGIEVVHKAFLKKIPTIVVTGFGNIEISDQLQQYKIRYFVDKRTFDDQVFKDQVKSIIDPGAPFVPYPAVREKIYVDIELTPAQIKQFKEVLIRAFSPGDMKQVTFFGIERRWETLVGSGNFDDQVNDLVMWANDNNKISPLLTAARERNPGNVRLREFEAQLLSGDKTPSVETPKDFQPTLPQPGSETLEALIFGPQRDSRLPLSFLQNASRTARSVGRLMVPRIINGVADGNAMFGTGWLIAPGIMITNHHVIDARDRRPKPYGLGESPATDADFRTQASRVVVHFDYYLGNKPGKDAVELHNATLLAWNERLDYAVIELAEANKVADRQPLRVLTTLPALARGTRLNIAQHPQSSYMQFAIRNNFYIRAGDVPTHIRYQTDTEPGASGSPVCDDDWDVVALHHASVPVASQSIPQEVINGAPVAVTILNEAISLSAILNDLPADMKQRILTAQGVL